MQMQGMFPARVTRDGDAYRWTYDLKAHHNLGPMWSMLRICLAIAVPIALVMLGLTWSYGPAQAALWSALFLALFAGLPVLLWLLLPPDPSFRMTETEITAWPKGRGNNVHRFQGVRRVILRPDIDRIQLRWIATGLHVYVPPEDYDFVREFILARVPKGAEVLWS